MSGVDEGVIGQRQQLVVQRPVELLGELFAVHPAEAIEVGAADVADEQRVAGEHPPGLRVGVLAHDDGDRLGRVAGGRADLERHLARTTAPARRPSGSMAKSACGALAVGDGCAGGRGELEVARQEVGVEVGLDHPLDAQAEFSTHPAR